MESLAELEVDEDTYTLANEETGEETELVVASVVEQHPGVVRVTFHGSRLRLWQVRDRIYVTDNTDEPIDDEWAFGEGMAEELLADEH